MADVDLRAMLVAARSIRLTDRVVGFDPDIDDPSQAARTDTLAEHIRMILRNPTADLTPTEQDTFRQAFGIVVRTNAEVVAAIDAEIGTDWRTDNALATRAERKADQALADAGSARQAALSAQGDAARAQDDANRAQTTANTADADARSARAVADSARTSAVSAGARADQAISDASNADGRAQAAQSGVRDLTAEFRAHVASNVHLTPAQRTDIAQAFNTVSLAGTGATRHITFGRAGGGSLTVPLPEPGMASDPGPHVVPTGTGYDATTQLLTLRLSDATTVQIDLSALVAESEFTGTAIAAALDTFIGNQDWRSRLAGGTLVTAIDTALGGTSWRAGSGSTQLTAEQIRSLLDGLLGTQWREPGLTLDQVRDAAGMLLATLSIFTYDPDTNRISTTLGTAATRDTGTAPGNVPVLGANGRLGADLLPDSGLSATDDAARARLDVIERDDWVTRERIADDAVGGREIGAGEVAEGHIAEGAVTSRKIPRDTINAGHIEANAVGESEIAGQSVGDAELKDDLRIKIDGKLNAADLETGMERQFRDNFELDDLPGFRGLNPARDDDGKFLTLVVTAGGDVSVGKVDAPTGGGGEDAQARMGVMSNADAIGVNRRGIAENATAIGTERTARATGDERLSERIAALRHFGFDDQIRITPRSVPNVAGLVRSYTLTLLSLQGIPDTARKVRIEIAGNRFLSDDAWTRDTTDFRIELSAATLDSLRNSRTITDDSHSLAFTVGFYDASYPDDGGQVEASSVAFFRPTLLIGDSADLAEPFTGREKAKLGRYAENPRANGASFIAPLETLETLTRVAYDVNAISAGTLAPGQFMIGGNPQRILARFSALDVDALGFLADGVLVAVGGATGQASSFSRSALENAWSAALPGDFSGVAVGDAVHFRLGPKIDPNAALSGVEDFARKDRSVEVPAAKTLGPLFSVGRTPFHFGASPDDPDFTSTATASGTLRFGTALSDTAVTNEVNAIPGSSFTILSGDATAPHAQIIVDCTARGIAIDRFTNLRLILRQPDGTVIAQAPMDVDPVSENTNLRLSLATLDRGSVLAFALGATVRGREQQVPVVLSNLRYQRDTEAPADPFVRDVAQAIVDREADAHEARDARIERELLAGDAKLAAPTTVINRAPSWEAVSSGPQEQTDADAFVIPASGFAQAVLGNFGVSPILHVDIWRLAGRQEVYSDPGGRIYLASDGTRVKVVNSNANGSGPYGGGFTGSGPTSQALLFGTRQLRWMTWPEAATPGSTVTLLTEAQVRALAAAARPPIQFQQTAAALQIRGNAEEILATAAITPSSSAGKIKITGGCQALQLNSPGNRPEASFDLRIYRGSTLVFEKRYGVDESPSNPRFYMTPDMVFVDEPGSTDQQTYQLRFIRRSGRDTNPVNFDVSKRQIILEEYR